MALYKNMLLLLLLLLLHFAHFNMFELFKRNFALTGGPMAFLVTWISSAACNLHCLGLKVGVGVGVGGQVELRKLPEFKANYIEIVRRYHSTKVLFNFYSDLRKKIIFTRRKNETPNFR